jgi:hypothetical protein
MTNNRGSVLFGCSKRIKVYRRKIRRLVERIRDEEDIIKNLETPVTHVVVL